MKNFPLYFIIGLPVFIVTALLTAYLAEAHALTEYARCWYILFWSLLLFVPFYPLGIGCGKLLYSPIPALRIASYAIGALVSLALGLIELWPALIPLFGGFTASLLTRTRFADWLAKP